MRIFMDHGYLIQTLHDNGVNRCLKTSNEWQLQRNLAEDRRIKMNQKSRDIQYSFMHLHLVHTKNNIYPLTFQDDKTSWDHSPDKLKWDFMDHTIDNHLTSRSANGIQYFSSLESKLCLLSTC
jgi:hypothetical protein